MERDYITMLTESDFNTLAHREFDGLLAGQNFRRVRDRTWLRSERAPIREMIELRAYKGAAYRPSWGFCLEFAPHISGQSVRWHRTDKSCLCDLIIDPCEPKRLARDEVSLFSTASDAIAALRVLVENTWDLSSATFRQVQTAEDLASLYEEMKCKKTNVWPWTMYTQFQISHAFVLAHLGRRADAVNQLDDYIERYSLDDSISRKLRTLLEKEMETASNHGMHPTK